MVFYFLTKDHLSVDAILTAVHGIDMDTLNILYMADSAGVSPGHMYCYNISVAWRNRFWVVMT